MLGESPGRSYKIEKFSKLFDIDFFIFQIQTFSLIFTQEKSFNFLTNLDFCVEICRNQTDLVEICSEMHSFVGSRKNVDF